MANETYKVRRVGGFIMATNLSWKQAKNLAIAIANQYEGGMAYVYSEQTNELKAIYHASRRED